MAVPPPSITPGHPDKPALRERLRADRAAFVAGLGPDGRARGAESAARLLLPHLPPGAVVALYLAFGDEIDPAPLLDLLAERGQKLALPALFDATTMEFRAWAPGDPIERGPFRLRQPTAAAAPAIPDVILMPLVGFDHHGGRIGQGKSHYDRAIIRYPGAHRIGYAWSVQAVTGRLPHDPWDMPLHGVVTELERIRMRDTAA